MSLSFRGYSSEYKMRVVEYYIVHHSGESFRSTARHFNIGGGHSLVKTWFDKYDGTLQSLESKRSPGRPRLLTHQQVVATVVQPIEEKNEAMQAVRYNEVLPLVRSETGADPSLRTIQRYGREEGIHFKSTLKRTRREGNTTQQSLGGPSSSTQGFQSQ